MVRTPLRTLLRALLAVFAVVALLGACGGDDDDSDTTTTTEADRGDDESTDDEATDDAAGDEGDDGADDGADDVCSLLDLDDLNEVTGEEFVNTDPQVDEDAQTASCTYTNAASTSVIVLNVSTIPDGADPELVIQGGASLCDEGTTADVEFTDADAGFACLASGVPTVAAVGDGAFAVLTGLTLTEGVSDEQVLAALAEILENAISG